MLCDKIRVFTTDKVELAPCNVDRAYSLVRKNKAHTFITESGELAIVLNKSLEQTTTVHKGGDKE